MQDKNKIIKDILQNTKLEGNSYLGSRVYSDEPILFTASQMKNFTPPKYREMRDLSKKVSMSTTSDAKVFCIQGRFMQDFDDDYNYTGSYDSMRPMYNTMNDMQLRGYFSWRARIRKSIYMPTLQGYILLYAYEVINGIGVQSPLDGYNILYGLYKQYKEQHNAVNMHLRIWLKDYVIYHGLPVQFLQKISSAHSTDVINVLLNCQQFPPDKLMITLQALSSHKLSSSKFFAVYKEDFTQITYLVYREISATFTPQTLAQYFGSTIKSKHNMFMNAVFDRSDKHADAVYEINRGHRYICKDNEWSCEKLFPYDEKGSLADYLLREIEIVMREKYKFKHKLKTTTANHTELIERVVTKFLYDKELALRPVINIDTSKLADIRESASQVQDRLTEYEEKDIEQEETEEVVAENNLLNATEMDFMRLMLNQLPYDSYLKDNNLLLSVLVDTINEKLFDEFADNIMSCDDSAEIFEDYTQDVKQLLGL